MKTLLVSIVLFFATSIFAEPSNNIIRPFAKDGVLDLRNIDFNKNTIVLLNGEWQFFWKKIYYPSDFKQKHLNQDFYIKVPSSWDKYRIDNQKLELDAYATYRLIILLPKKQYRLKLNTLHKTPASRYFINNQLVGWSGSINDNDFSIEPEFSNQFQEFEANTDTLEIVAHVVNRQVDKSGLIYSISLGNAESLDRQIEKKLFTNVFLIGVFFIMFLYHLSLWYFRKKDRELLYFAATCLTLTLYFFHTSNLINIVFPNLNFEVSFKILRMSLFATVPAFTLFIYTFFPNEYKKFIMYPLVIIGSICVLFVLLTPSYIHRQIADYYRLFMLTGVLSSIVVILWAYTRKREYAGHFLVGYVFFAITAVNDLLRYLGYINSVDLLQFGLFAFIITQTLMLSSRISIAFKRVEIISSDLKITNENLENIVDQRTEILTKQNIDIEQQSERINQQNQDIVLYNNQINESLVYASRIQNAMLPSPQQIDLLHPPFFVLMKPKQIVSGDFYWMKSIDNYLIMVVADSTGHGVPGAFMSILGISFLNEMPINNTNIVKPNQILDKLRVKVAQALNQSESTNELRDGMDISIFTIDIVNKILYYAGAKMPLYIVRQEVDNYKIIKLDPSPYTIGIDLEKKLFECTEFQLQENDALYSFSDGYINQFGGKIGEKYNIKNFENLLQEIQPYTMEAQKRKIQNAFEAWKGENWHQVDDVIVMGVKII